MAKSAWVVLVLLAALPTAPAADPVLPKIRVGLLEGMFRDVPKPLLNAMAEPFRSLMMRQTGLTGDVEICTSSSSLAGKLKDRTVSIGVFHGFEYAWAKQADPNLQPLLVTVPHGRKVQAMIVVKADSEMKTVADLKGKGVLIPRNLKAHAQLFLDKVQAKNPNVKTAPNPATMNSEEALTAVASGSEQAVLTDIATLSGYYGLQPGAAKHLRLLVESEMFPVAVIATSKGSLSEDSMDRIRNGLGGSSKTGQGRTMLTMWNLKGFEEVPADYEDACKKILAHYPPPAAVPAVTNVIVKQEK